MGVEKFDQLANAVTEARREYEAFAGGTKIAATRARKRLQEIKRIAQEIRDAIQTERQPEAGEPPAPPAGEAPKPPAGG
jgi:hypothetical protein